MKLYKLMDENKTTLDKTQWTIGVTIGKTPYDDPQRCSSDVLHTYKSLDLAFLLDLGCVLHAYKSLNLAFLLDLVHGYIKNSTVAECEGDVVVEDGGKVGCFALTPLRWIDPPEWVGSHYEKQVRVQFAVLCAESVAHLYNEQYTNDSRINDAIHAAKKYLKNPSATAADAAYDPARAAARAANEVTSRAYGAHDAAHAAAHAAVDAAYAAYVAAAEDVYDVAEDAAYAAESAANADAYATSHADSTHIDFCELADRAVRMVQEGQR